MKFQFGNNEVTNPIAKVLLLILALFIVIAALGLVGFILVPVAVFVIFVLVLVALIVPFAAVFGAGRWMKGIRGSGEIMTEIRDVKPFTGISLALPCHVEITNGQDQEVTIETDDNILGYILSYVQDDILHLNSKNNLTPSKHIQIKISTDKMSKLKISGTSNVDLDKIKEENLKLNISGSGKIRGNGKVDNLDITISGMGAIDFKEIKSKSAKLKISGSGKADLYVEESLDAMINGAGKANIWGKPSQVNKRINGLGKINIH